MFWIGVLITISSGLISNESFRKRFFRRLSRLSPRQIDVVSGVLLFVGVLISAIQYISDQADLRTINKQVDTLELQEIADYNVFGHKSAAWNGIPLVRTPLNGWCDSFVSRADGLLTWKCDEKSDRICREVLSKAPRFPFAHFFLAVSAKKRGDLSWRSEAKIALQIFQGTTRLARHSSDHDYFLSATQELLRDPK